jgi:hypothetical protein
MAGKPSNVGPMKPCARPRACASSWLHELKHDGYRIIGLKAGRARHSVDPLRRGFHQQVGEDRGGELLQLLVNNSLSAKGGGHVAQGL